MNTIEIKEQNLIESDIRKTFSYYTIEFEVSDEDIKNLIFDKYNGQPAAQIENVQHMFIISLNEYVSINKLSDLVNTDLFEVNIKGNENYLILAPRKFVECWILLYGVDHDFHLVDDNGWRIKLDHVKKEYVHYRSAEKPKDSVSRKNSLLSHVKGTALPKRQVWRPY